MRSGLGGSHINASLFNVPARQNNVKLNEPSVVASFAQYLRPSLHVIPAKARIHCASLQECPDYELDSRFRGNDVRLVSYAGSNDAATRQGDLPQPALILIVATISVPIYTNVPSADGCACTKWFCATYQTVRGCVTTFSPCAS